MAVSFVAASSGTSAAVTSTSFATTLPTGWAAGDVAVLVGHVSATNLTMSTPAGWTAIPGITNPTNESTNSRIYAWYRVLQAGDTAPTITNSGATTGGWDMAAYRGADQASPIGQAAAAGTSAVTSRALPPLTGVTAGAALHAFAHARVATGTIPTGLDWAAAYTESLDVATSRATTNANLRLATARQLVTTAGNYGGEAVTVANTVSSSVITGLIEIKAAGATPSTVTLTPASLTLAAPAVGPAPAPVTVALTPAVLALSAQPVSSGPPPAAVTLTPAAFALSAVAPTVFSATGPVPVTLFPAILTLSPVAPTPVPRAVNRTLTPAVLRLGGIPVGLKPGAATVTLTAAVVDLTAAPVAPSSRRTMTLTPAEFTLHAAPVALVFLAAPHTVSASGTPHHITGDAPGTPIASAIPAARVTAAATAPASVRRTA